MSAPSCMLCGFARPFKVCNATGQSGVCWECSEATMAARKRTNAVTTEITGSTSDGYHTFDELYAYRMAYNAALFNQWAALGLYEVHKSWKHSDGEPCFGGGWFIVVAQLPTGQISNHYKTDHWKLFRCEVRETGALYDGHTPQIALQRLLDFTQLGRGGTVQLQRAGTVQPQEHAKATSVGAATQNDLSTTEAAAAFKAGWDVAYCNDCSNDPVDVARDKAFAAYRSSQAGSVKP